MLGLPISNHVNEQRHNQTVWHSTSQASVSHICCFPIFVCRALPDLIYLPVFGASPFPSPNCEAEMGQEAQPSTFFLELQAGCPRHAYSSLPLCSVTQKSCDSCTFPETHRFFLLSTPCSFQDMDHTPVNYLPLVLVHTTAGESALWFPTVPPGHSLLWTAPSSFQGLCPKLSSVGWCAVEDPLF